MSRITRHYGNAAPSSVTELILLYELHTLLHRIAGGVPYGAMAPYFDGSVITLRYERIEGDRAASEPVEVPYTMLSPEALRVVLESVVLREGAD